MRKERNSGNWTSLKRPIQAIGGVLDMDPQYAEAHYIMGLCSRKKAIRKPLECNILKHYIGTRSGFRPDTPINAIARTVASQSAGSVLLLDSAMELRFRQCLCRKARAAERFSLSTCTSIGRATCAWGVCSQRVPRPRCSAGLASGQMARRRRLRESRRVYDLWAPSYAAADGRHSRQTTVHEPARVRGGSGTVPA